MKYKTVQELVESSLTIKKSKFIGMLFPLHEEQEAESILASIRKQHPAARHHCFAYCLHANPVLERMSDDGEPSGTAGAPILKTLQGAALQDVMAVVVRYFGGTLLGTGGLVRAYSDAVKLCIEAAQIQEMVFCHQIQMELDYAYYGQIEKKCLPAFYGAPDIAFGEKVQILASLPVEVYDQMLSQFQSLTNRQGLMTIQKSWYVPR
jgi:uncharacterized YigZ family protein